MVEVYMKGFDSEKQERVFSRRFDLGEIGQKRKTDNVEVDIPLPRLSIVEFSAEPREGYRTNEAIERTKELIDDLSGKVSCVTNFTYIKSLNEMEFPHNEIIEWIVLGLGELFPTGSYYCSNRKHFGRGGTEIYIGIESFGPENDSEKIGEIGYSLSEKMGLIDPQLIRSYDKEKVVDIVKNNTRRVF